MKKTIYSIYALTTHITLLFCTLLVFTESKLLSCPTCIGTVDRNTPVFFSDDFYRAQTLNANSDELEEEGNQDNEHQGHDEDEHHKRNDDHNMNSDYNWWD